MKKVLTLLTLFLLAFNLSGCSQKQTTTTDNANPGNREFRKPDFGQPERMADITGLVKSVIGNEVTILKIERPQRTGNEGGSNNPENLRNTNQNNSTNQAPAFGGATGGQPGVPGMRGGFNRQNLDSDSQKAMLERIKSMSTGEIKVIIPVGIKMLKSDTTTEKPSMIEATLADITKDKMISIWTEEKSNENPETASSTDNASSRNIASFVMIMR